MARDEEAAEAADAAEEKAQAKAKGKARRGSSATLHLMVASEPTKEVAEVEDAITMDPSRADKPKGTSASVVGWKSGVGINDAGENSDEDWEEVDSTCVAGRTGAGVLRLSPANHPLAQREAAGKQQYKQPKKQSGATAKAKIAQKT